MNNKILRVVMSVAFIIGISISNINATDNVKQSAKYIVKTNQREIPVIVLVNKNNIAKDFVYSGKLDIEQASDKQIKQLIGLVTKTNNTKIIRYKKECLSGCKPEEVKYTVVADNAKVDVYGYNSDNSTVLKVDNNIVNINDKILSSLNFKENEKVIKVEKVKNSIKDTFVEQEGHNKAYFSSSDKVIVIAAMSIAYLFPIVIIFVCMYASRKKMKRIMLSIASSLNFTNK